MDDPTTTQSHGGDDGIPESLRRDLERLYAPDEPIDVSREIDRHMVRMAQWRLSKRVVASAGQPRGVSEFTPFVPPRRRVFPLRLVAITAAAAVLLLGVLIAPRFIRSAPTPAGLSNLVRGDVNTDGRVDIVDALLLSKLAAGDPDVTARLGAARPDHDINADGVLDQQDALAVRALVVKLNGGAG